jgi:hypothetical protein
MTKLRFTKTNRRKLEIAHNALKATRKPVYFIERACVSEDHVDVSFINEEILNTGLAKDEDWKDVRVSLISLETFAIMEFQDVTVCSDLTIAHFIDYNLNEVVKAYLEAGKETMI